MLLVADPTELAEAEFAGGALESGGSETHLALSAVVGFLDQLEFQVMGRAFHASLIQYIINTVHFIQ